MKKLSISFLLILFFVQLSHATEINLGLNLGYRQLKDPDLNETYGDGFVYNPYIIYFPLDMYGLEISCEGGYKKDAPIGLFQEDSTLSVGGLQLCGIFRYRVWHLVPYFKFGLGYFSYKQDIESEFVRLKVDHHKWTTVVGGGVNLKLSKSLFIVAELKYVPLKVKPFGIRVDLGGMRYLIGLGLNLPM